MLRLHDILYLLWCKFFQLGNVWELHEMVVIFFFHLFRIFLPRWLSSESVCFWPHVWRGTVFPWVGPPCHWTPLPCFLVQVNIFLQFLTGRKGEVSMCTWSAILKRSPISLSVNWYSCVWWSLRATTDILNRYPQGSGNRCPVGEDSNTTTTRKVAMCIIYYYYVSTLNTQDLIYSLHNQWSRYYCYPRLTDEALEAHRGPLTCPSTLS